MRNKEIYCESLDSNNNTGSIFKKKQRTMSIPITVGNFLAVEIIILPVEGRSQYWI